MSRDPSRPWILGLASSHNGAACLLHGDEIVVAIQEERLLRIKRATHKAAYRSLAVQYCLDYAGITAASLSAIAVSASAESDVPAEDVTLNEALQPVRHGIETMMVAHHLAHAYAAFATSGFADAAILIVDGSGSPWNDLPEDERRVARPGQAERYAAPGRGPLMEIVSMYAAHDACVTPVEKHVSSRDLRPKMGMGLFWSLGYMYEFVADHIFRSGLDSAGKLMGLAPYGKPTTPVSDFYDVRDGGIEFLNVVPDRYRGGEAWPAHREEYQDLAASTQAALEEALLMLAARCRTASGGARRLCYAGGVALNSVANERLVREAGFDDIFIMPAAEDSGTAIGAAYYALWRLTGRNTHRRLVHDALGRRYGAADIDAAIRKCPAIRAIEQGGEATLDRAVDLLAQGKIVGWFQGRSELGPRALGQRSIVCDPRHTDMKQVLNERVKFREAFRPFAPVLPVDRLSTCFESTQLDESPFMLRVLPFKADARLRTPAVVHVDGTGRVQTVAPEANGRFYELVARFASRTGSPILLNTSFNVAGEPIVETPEDALSCLLLTGLDACVLEDTLVEKSPRDITILDLTFSMAVDRIGVDWCLKGGERRRAAADLRMPNFYAVHLDRAAEVEQAIAASSDDLLRVVTHTRWGPVLCITSANLLPLLDLIDGSRTGWQLLTQLQQDIQPSFSPSALVQMLTRLKRLGVVEWHEPHAAAALTSPAAIGSTAAAR
jgi:carbamoyltransferase